MHVRRESLWDGDVHGIESSGSYPELLALSTLESLNVDDDFLSKLKGAYASYSHFSNEDIDQRKRHNIEKSSNGLFRYYHRVVIPRPVIALIKTLVNMNITKMLVTPAIAD